MQNGQFDSVGQPAIESLRVGTKCNLKMDDDLKMVMEFMQSNMAASKLVSVAHALAAVAPITWGRYAREEVRALDLQHPVIGDATSQSAAT